MIDTLNEPVAIFLTIMAVILITPMLSERIRLPGIVGIILGGMLIGQHGFNLLTTTGPIEFLATAGLIYLMFSAGLEVDIHQFKRVGKRALVFGLLTYLIPQLMGIGLGRLLGMGWLGSILLGSAFSSHTLIAFPILTRLGVTRNEAVAVTAGATVFTDITAFLVLAAVLGMQEQTLQAGFFIKLILLLGVYAILLLFGLPRFGKILFRRVSSRAVEFQLILVILFVSALIALKIGVHEVVGAFLAGLAVNATLPHRSPVIGHVLFIGESFFIPIFLMYSGMLTDPLVFLQGWETLLIGVGVTAVAYLSKFLAAWIIGKVFHYSKVETGTIFGLSHAQAAVTIPTLVIGLQYGLFSDSLFNAAILMILFTSITSPLVVQHFAPHLTNGKSELVRGTLFSRIMVPIANPKTQEHLVTLASLLAGQHQGTLYVLNVALEVGGKVTGLEHQQELLGKVADIVGDTSTNLVLLPRVDQSYAQGIQNAALEKNASLILMGWRGKAKQEHSLMGSVLDEVIWGLHQPVLVGRLVTPVDGIRRVVLVLPPNSLPPSAIRHTVEVMTTLSNALNVPALVMAGPPYEEKLKPIIEKAKLEPPYQFSPIRGNLLKLVLEQTGESDLLVLPSSGSRRHFYTHLGDLPERLVETASGNVMVLHYQR